MPQENPMPVPAPSTSNTQPVKLPLTPEQQVFVSKWSFGAFSMSWIYDFASGLIADGFLMFVPFYNIYVWIRNIGKGRQRSWEKGGWADFAAFEKRQKLLDKIGIFFLIALVALIVVIFISVFAVLSAPTKAANAFMDDLVAGQPQAAYSMTSSVFEQRTTADGFTQSVANSALSNIQTYNFTNRSENSVNGSIQAVMLGTAVLKDGTTKPLELDLLKENGIWKIQYAAIGSGASTAAQ